MILLKTGKAYWITFASVAGVDVQPAKSELKVRSGKGESKVVRDPVDDAEALAEASRMKTVRGLVFYPVRSPCGTGMELLGMFAPASAPPVFGPPETPSFPAD